MDACHGICVVCVKRTDNVQVCLGVITVETAEPVSVTCVVCLHSKTASEFSFGLII